MADRTVPPPTPPAVTNANRISEEIISFNPHATFVIVTKTQPIEMIRILIDAGFREFGENRVGQFMERQAIYPDVNWHFIGRLQRKNAAKVVGRAELIHSVDSVRLLEKIERSCCAAEQLLLDTGGEGGGSIAGGTRHDLTTGGNGVKGKECGLFQRVLLQVNTSGEEVKQGFSPDELQEFARSFDPDDCPHVKVEGLMTMAPFTNDQAVIRSTFSSLTRLRDEINAKFGLSWNELSMGMSNDYGIALEEGATMVRVGSAVFR